MTSICAMKNSSISLKAPTLNEIEGCNLWRTYVYPIPYLIYKPMCVHVCVGRGDDICIYIYT